MPHMATSISIGIFTRPPIAGQTKTRLIPALGAQQAAHVHQQLLEQTVATAAQTHAALTLWVTEQPHHPVFAALTQRFNCHIAVQDGADLGGRMQHALASMLQHAPRALVIGSDCAVHSAASLQAASDALQQADMVFTPAEDGGYVLVGARTVHAAAFAQIDWGTVQVMRQTRERLSAAAVHWHELPPLWDIDTPQDVQRAYTLGLLKI
jgi:uncharacterized protein